MKFEEPKDSEFAKSNLCPNNGVPISAESNSGLHGYIDISELYNLDDLQNDGGYVPRGEKCPHCGKWLNFNSADSEEMDCMIEAIKDGCLEINNDVIDRFKELGKRTGRTDWKKLLKH